MNFSHLNSESEIPEGVETERDSTSVVTSVLSNKERILECLREAGGDSLSISEISEETDIEESLVRKTLRKLSKGDVETLEVFEDENELGSYFLTEPMIDRLAMGASA